MNAEELFSKWDIEIHAFRRRGVFVNGADVVAEVLDDVRSVLADERDAVITLTEASRRCGYSAAHLGRLVRDGVIPNAGRPNAPRVRSGDLPKKPLRVATQPTGPYDPHTDARSLLSRQRGGRHG